jgi:acetate kinase
LQSTGGASSIRFAIYDAVGKQRRRLDGKIDRIGSNGTKMVANGLPGKPQVTFALAAADHRTAIGFLLDWLESQPVFESVKAAGHRVVQGLKHSEPERVTPKLVAELHRITVYDPDHLPRELSLIEALQRRHPKLPQVACFDTAFHRTMRLWRGCSRSPGATRQKA